MAIPEHPRVRDAHPAIWHMIRVFLHDLDVDDARLARALDAITEGDQGADPAQWRVVVERAPNGDYRDYHTGDLLGNERDEGFTVPSNWQDVVDIEDDLPYRRTIFDGVPEDLSFGIRDWVNDYRNDAIAYLDSLGIARLPVTEEDLTFVPPTNPTSP